MKLRTKILSAIFLLALMFVIGAPVAFFGFWIIVSGGSDAGSPELARQWRGQLNQYATWREARQAEPAIEIVKFDSGEWLFGKARNSHGMWRSGGGTMVVKDSTGQTHAFYGGHVCGDGFLGWGFSGADDLDAFYRRVADSGFHEYEFE